MANGVGTVEQGASAAFPQVFSDNPPMPTQPTEAYQIPSDRPIISFIIFVVLPRIIWTRLSRHALEVFLTLAGSFPCKSDIAAAKTLSTDGGTATAIPKATPWGMPSPQRQSKDGAPLCDHRFSVSAATPSALAVAGSLRDNSAE